MSNYPGPGPSGIKRVTKWNNRFKKSAQHAKNLLDKAEANKQARRGYSNKPRAK